MVQQCIEEGWLIKAKNYIKMGIAYMLFVSLIEYFIIINIEKNIIYFFNLSDAVSNNFFSKYCDVYLRVLFVDNFC